MLYLLGVIFFVLAIALSIGLHELGHLVAAKIFKVRCPKYFVGFGPTVWSRQVGETEYGIKAIPLGGFVSMVGGYAPRSGDQRPPRTAIGRWARGIADDTRAADAEQLLPTDTHRVIYKLSWWKQVIIYLAGPVVNLVLATAVIGSLLVFHGVAEPTTQVKTVVKCLKTEGAENSSTCEVGDPVSPAAAAGLRPGDEIVAVDGREVTSWDDLSRGIRASAGTSQRWTVVRQGERLELTVAPQTNERKVYENGRAKLGADGQPLTEKVGYVGVAPSTRQVTISPLAVPGQMGEAMWANAQVIVALPLKLWDIGVSTFTGTPRDPNGPMSIVGVGRISGEILEGGDTGDVGWEPRLLTFTALMASLNLALFLFNVIPLIPLDGGHVLLALWQALKRGIARIAGRPDPGYVDKAAAMPLAIAVMVFFIGMTVFLVFADLVNPVQMQG